MRVRVYLFSLNAAQLAELIVSDWERLLENTNQLLEDKGIDPSERAETLECVKECIGVLEKSDTGLPELLNAMCWFLEANGQKTEVDAFNGWKSRYYDEFKLSELSPGTNPNWLPVLSESAPHAFLIMHGEQIRRVIDDLEAMEWDDEFESEYVEARDELVDVLQVIKSQHEDVVVVALTN